VPESRRFDADNRERDLVQRDGRADHVGPAAEAALPVSVIQHRNRLPWTIVCSLDQAAQRRRQAQRR
jgi:hypothetical protein